MLCCEERFISFFAQRLCCFAPIWCYFLESTTSYLPRPLQNSATTSLHFGMLLRFFSICNASCFDTDEYLLRCFRWLCERVFIALGYIFFIAITRSPGILEHNFFFFIISVALPFLASVFSIAILRCVKNL